MLVCPLAFGQVRAPVAANEVELVYPGLVDREALVELEFTVNREGSVVDMHPVGGFHEQRFVDATMAAVQQLQFRPATENGAAVDWPGFRVHGRFVVQDWFNTVHPSFSNAMVEIEKAIQDGDIARAETMALRVLQEDVLYFYEYAYINTRLSEIYLLTNNLFDGYLASLQATQAYRENEHMNFGLESARMRDQFKVALLFNNQAITDDTFISNKLETNDSLVMATSVTQPTQLERPRHIRSSVRFSNWGSDQGDKPTMDVLNSMLMKNALQTGVQIFARLGYITPLLNDYDRFSREEPRIPDFLQTIDGLAEQTTASGAPLKSTHRISGDQWLFFPYRRTFAVAEVAGRLDTVDFQCDRTVVRMPVQADSEYGIPASWGNCALRFRGDDGTTFSVIEFAD